jgi:hypothetical protein
MKPVLEPVLEPMLLMHARFWRSAAETLNDLDLIIIYVVTVRSPVCSHRNERIVCFMCMHLTIPQILNRGAMEYRKSDGGSQSQNDKAMAKILEQEKSVASSIKRTQIGANSTSAHNRRCKSFCPTPLITSVAVAVDVPASCPVCQDCPCPRQQIRQHTTIMNTKQARWNANRIECDANKVRMRTRHLFFLSA